jgi:predicted ATPase
MNMHPIKGYLDHVEIRGFRSLKDVSVDLSPLTVLIGANGAGKSNFIKFFDLVTHLMKGNSLKRWVEDEGGAEDLLCMGSRTTWHIMASLGITTYHKDKSFKYHVSLRNVGIDNLAFTEELLTYQQNAQSVTLDGDVLGESYDQSVLPFAVQNPKLTDEKKQIIGNVVRFLVDCRAYQFHDTSKHATIKKLHDTSDCVYLNSDGGNLAAVLLSLQENEPKRFKLIEKQISRVLTSFDSFVLEPQHGKVMLRWRHKQGDKIMGAHLTSDGSLRLFCLITLLNLPVEQLPDIILLDEPELGLHPNAITLIAAMIQRVSHTSQVILATQSPFMVDCFELDNIVVADLEEGATRLRKLAKETYQQWLDDEFSVSELWLSNVLGGQP